MMMKLLLLALALASSSCHAFVVPSQPLKKTCLNANNLLVDRRNFGQAAIAIAGSTAFVAPALAVRGDDYVPKFDDVKQIYILGATLDKLNEKLEDPDKVEAALEGVRLFNKDPKFYPGYAQNYISKKVLNNADGDVRVGYIRQACTLIGSLQSILELEEGMVGKQATEESIKRIKKAQVLIGKFLAESGVEDEKISNYVAEHK